MKNAYTVIFTDGTQMTIFASSITSARRKAVKFLKPIQRITAW